MRPRYDEVLDFFMRLEGNVSPNFLIKDDQSSLSEGMIIHEFTKLRIMIMEEADLEK